MTVVVQVRPRSGRRAVEVRADGSLLVRVTEPAEDGRANAAVIEALAAHFGVARRLVSIARGATSRRKLVEIPGRPTR
jgi:uncharacterized protein (TIGR00251 family)